MKERPNRIKDLTGKQFGRLTVLSMHKERINKKIHWLCKCNCEFKTEFLVQGNNLRSGNTTKCKFCSHKSRIIDLIGQKFDRLAVKELIGSENQSALWKCECECGRFITKSSAELTRNVNNSCGCLHAESMKTMGESVRILNEYDLSGEYGIGYTSKDEPFYFDLEDYDKIKKYTWRYNEDGYLTTQPFGEIIRMHMLIMDSDGIKDVDHKDHVTYDNRKSNLRICEHFENIIHSKTYINNTSGRKGVYWDKSRNKWMAMLTHNKKTEHLGRFDNFEDAVHAREVAEEKYHGEFHCEL